MYESKIIKYFKSKEILKYFNFSNKIFATLNFH